MFKRITAANADTGYGYTGNIQENQEAVNAHREERRCTCVSTYWYA
jgi:hypothetical protein